MNRYIGGQGNTVVPIACYGSGCCYTFAHNDVITEWRDNQGVITQNQAAQRGDIEMVVVIVAQKDCVNRWQLGEINARSDQTGSVRMLSPAT